MRTALLVIDAQRIYTNDESDYYCDEAGKTLTEINALISQFRESKNLIIFIKHQHKIDGTDAGNLFNYAGDEEGEDIGFLEGSSDVQMDSAIEIQKDDPVIIKTRYSAFKSTNLAETLLSKGIERIAVCGFMTNFCCLATAIDAFDSDYFVDFITEATGTPGTENSTQDELRKSTSEILGAGFARIFDSSSDYAF